MCTFVLAFPAANPLATCNYPTRIGDTCCSTTTALRSSARESSKWQNWYIRVDEHPLNRSTVTAQLKIRQFVLPNYSIYIHTYLRWQHRSWQHSLSSFPPLFATIKTTVGCSAYLQAITHKSIHTHTYTSLFVLHTYEQDNS